MKSTGIVRKLDELGRIVIPKELRRTLGIEVRDPLEILIDEEKIVLKKYANRMACLVTGDVSDNNLFLAGGKVVISREAAKVLTDEITRQL